MKKIKKIRLTEQDLHAVIRESVENILSEMEDFRYDVNDYRDLGTTTGIGAEGFRYLMNAYKLIESYIRNFSDDWELLHATDWYRFFSRLSDIPRKVLFSISDRGEASQETMGKLERLIRDAQDIPYPDLSTSSNSSFGEKASEIRSSLKYAYRIYGDFIDYLVSLHDEPEMKKADMEADWKKFAKTRREADEKSMKAAWSDKDERDFRDIAFKNNMRRGALDRYDIVNDPENEENRKYHDMLIGKF